MKQKCNSVGCKNTDDFRREGSFRICNKCGCRVVVLRGDING